MIETMSCHVREKRRVQTHLSFRDAQGEQKRVYIPVARTRRPLIDGISTGNLLAIDCDIYKSAGMDGGDHVYTYSHTQFGKTGKGGGSRQLNQKEEK